MARQIKHFERVEGIRSDMARLNPDRFPHRIAEIAALADELEAKYKAMGVWKKACYGLRCECRKD